MIDKKINHRYTPASYPIVKNFITQYISKSAYNDISFIKF